MDASSAIDLNPTSSDDDDDAPAPARVLTQEEKRLQEKREKRERSIREQQEAEVITLSSDDEEHTLKHARTTQAQAPASDAGASGSDEAAAAEDEAALDEGNFLCFVGFGGRDVFLVFIAGAELEDEDEGLFSRAAATIPESDSTTLNRHSLLKRADES